MKLLRAMGDAGIITIGIGVIILSVIATIKILNLFLSQEASGVVSIFLGMFVILTSIIYNREM